MFMHGIADIFVREGRATPRRLWVESKKVAWWKGFSYSGRFPTVERLLDMRHGTGNLQCIALTVVVLNYLIFNYHDKTP